ncbi:MAG: type IV pili twitching motility protein PilT [Candidatus Magasanikbacteria bacterium CG10_big_fil_rev_8_21_14_0_10_36_32]|uniref:Type IV pili twitching motility protein PilT n=1 Tax=Candidatus Magasanikbacteria bacterium CG10_big_fil_rev_8_21_14_0_10_36_32 TaxID=1974646 RepID=A0A2M6W5G1_9BACT|nr:MAG: type IV pili twitching motility protein PilT [Candidatus Magasanikbacteria bacterium CG10_big_fil_rev_8_21_14_0_10_36_32]
MEIDKYFNEAIKQKASDVHLVGEEVPMLRLSGVLKELSDKKLDNEELKKGLYTLLSKDQQVRFEEEMELDFAHKVGNDRFRVNLHLQDDKIGMAARLIPENIPSPEELKFESALLDMTGLMDGLVLITGPTGSGKSTTLACMIEEINKTRKAHIVTVEDPVEFMFKDKESLIEQREVGKDTKSFAAALKHVLRQDPNVILVGEMRDPETISTVLTAAETGHLVFSTLHTPTAAEAVERIVDVFEGAKQKQVLIQFSSVLRGIVAQQLMPAKDGGRVPAREILINTPAVSNLIRENNISQIKSAIQTGLKEGMQSMENSVKQLLKDGLIDEEMAEKRSGRSKKV